MNQLRRIAYGVMATIGLAMLGLIYNEVALMIIDLAVNEHSGLYTERAQQVEAVVPIVITGMLLGVWAWVLVGGIQKEKSAIRRRI